jgi:serine/threonine protein kinase
MGDDSISAMCAAHGPVASACRFSIGTIFGDWRVTAFIGRGGSGEVYCAEHIALGTSAAVKVLVRDEHHAKERFTREANLLSELKSTSFPQFYSYGEANGCPYLAMELLEPGELPAGERNIARFLLSVCDAVAELHSLGYIHRDIKPSNILWRTGTTGGSPVAVPVLSDLGLAKKIETSIHPPTNLPNHLATIGVGTPGYGAPEQMERGEATVASDIHALGVLADQCFGGKPPRTWARIIRRATSSIPAHRYPSVAAFVRAIRWRHIRRYALTSLGCAAFAVASVAVLQKPVGRLWTRWQTWRKAPVLNASAQLDGRDAADVRWYMNDSPIVLPYRFADRDGGLPNWIPRHLSAVAEKNGKMYSSPNVDIVPTWEGRREVSLSLHESLESGTPIRIWASYGTPFDFAWCPPGTNNTGGAGFWMATKRLTGRQFRTFLEDRVSRHTPISWCDEKDLSPDRLVRLEFNFNETVPVVSFPDYGLTIGPPAVAQWRRGIGLVEDFDGKSPEWALVPPTSGDGIRSRGGWMRMDGAGKEEFIANLMVYHHKNDYTAYVRCIAESAFQNETNVVLYCRAQALLRSAEPDAVARGEAMLKGFFQSDDDKLSLLAKACCIERGTAVLDDFGGVNAARRLRFAAVRRGDSKTLEQLAVSDPDSDIRKAAYESMADPSPMVTAMYIAQIRVEDDPGDLSKPLKAVRNLCDREALVFLAEHGRLKIIADEARARLAALDAE